MKVIALTGGIASGKSTISQYIKDKGFVVIDADCIYHRLTNTKSELTIKIGEVFGENVINSDGSLNRKNLSEIVFNDKNKLLLLNTLSHPVIKEEMRKEILSNKKEKTLFIDVPLLFEAHFEDLADDIWLIYVSKDLQIKRLMERNNLSYEECKKRIDSQMKVEDKIKLSNRIIDNSYTLKKTFKQIDDFVMNL